MKKSRTSQTQVVKAIQENEA
ncbi:MAG: hypothetical protein JWQ14_2038, partial [Adhaeribacter sp.]|nr:hypothetical protein [Adhaeribacter sp.]